MSDSSRKLEALVDVAKKALEEKTLQGYSSVSVSLTWTETQYAAVLLPVVTIELKK
jgi:hypothetical protein